VNDIYKMVIRGGDQNNDTDGFPETPLWAEGFYMVPAPS
jgi:hypothetical protein